MTLVEQGETTCEATFASGDVEALYAWAESQVGRVFGGDARVHLVRPDYDLPEHPVAHGRPFSNDIRPALDELGTWFAYAAETLARVHGSEEHATPVRCWPHHFDLATLILLDPTLGAESGRSVGVGFSPGDALIDQPYWYVNAHPRPAVTLLPRLPGGGQWNSEGWFGAVLTRQHVLDAGDGAERTAKTDTFLRSAVATMRDLLGGQP